ncbi:MAG: hypothetical protein JXR58_10985 [Bacteroidales bacterium]|nr:hypothetical protein [Bacteroidales bacterium]
MNLLLMRSLRNIFTLMLLVALGFFMHNTKDMKEKVSSDNKSTTIETAKENNFSKEISYNKKELLPFDSSRWF